ncbi:hypothetical protein BDV33DRAFT_162212 [Aspergillus novoparasiticus]|uniref:Uncharacterized protein n=1 Tax=Aspergillus novoparasiticus TaxID=986946 RepID=A0A5N6F968_9EURO|nr:hypothetical protein BDV33DRAFT_162212 [Aspergillus novoparasiticus]
MAWTPETIIALVTLLVTSPSTFLTVWKHIRRKRRCTGDSELFTSTPSSDLRPSRCPCVHPEIALEMGVYREAIPVPTVGTWDMSVYRGYSDKSVVYICSAAKVRDTTMAELFLSTTTLGLPEMSALLEAQRPLCCTSRDHYYDRDSIEAYQGKICVKVVEI